MASLIDPGKLTSCLLLRSQAICVPLPDEATKYRLSGENVIASTRNWLPLASDSYIMQLTIAVKCTICFLPTRVEPEATSIRSSSSCEFKHASTEPSGDRAV